MKTLKLQLLVASMFACGTAFAQGANQGIGAPVQQNGPSGARPPIPTANTGTATGQGARSASTNDAYIMQGNNGTNSQNLGYVQNTRNQYAIIDQSGTVTGNSADIYQGTNNVGSFNNNASQTQVHSGGVATKNTAYIDQEGTNSTAIQSQTGGGNRAYIQQDLGANNYASQTQSGDNNRAFSIQDGSNGVVYQQQTGATNYASVDHSGTNSAYSSTAQQGTSNTAIVTQH